MLVVTVLFWLASKLGFVFSNHGHLTPVWPPAAVACAAALLFGRRALLGVALFIIYDYLEVNFAQLERYPKALVEPMAMMVAATAVGWAARRWGFRGRLNSIRSVFVMLGLALVYSAVNAAMMSTGYCMVFGTAACAKVGWPVYWVEAVVGDVFGCLICMPALLSWLRAADKPLSEGWSAAAKVLGGSLRLEGLQWRFVLTGLAATAVAWWVTRHVAVPVHVVGYLALPLLVWAALRFSPGFVHGAILAIGLVTISLQLTAQSQAVADPVTHIASLFLFLLSVSALTLLVNAVVQKQKLLSDALAFRAQQERLELMLAAASDAVISFDQNGYLSYWNPAATRMFGVRADQTIGRRVDNFLPIPGLADLGGDLARLLEAQPELFSGHVLSMEALDTRGQPLPVEVTLKAYRNGTDWNATAFVRDARAHLLQQEALRQAKERAEEATRVKSLFLATMSHELRTPLSGVIGMLQLTLRGEMQWATRAKVNLALQNAEALLAIINDILDYSKIEAGKMSFEHVDFDLRELLQGLTALMEMNAQEKGLSLICRIGNEVPQWLRSDPVRLRQVLFNLLGNALKFTERGFVELRVNWHAADGEGPARLVVEVEDTGIGISEEARARLFRGFEQADISTSRHYGGTGLGLAISKSLIEGLGGEISVRSTEGVGTCFCFWVAAPVGQPVEAPLPVGAGPFDVRLKILCAEDGPTNQMIARAFVEDMGHEIEFVDNGREAVMRCTEERFDVILMDGRMPVMDGMDATRAIRAGGLDDHWVLEPDVWIIALTANATLQDREQCLGSGMNDFLSKPVDELQLAAALHRAVRVLKERGRPLTPKAPAGPQAAVELEGLLLDAPAGAAPPVTVAPPPAMRDHNALKQRLRRAFLQDGRKTLDTLRDALQAEDWPTAARMAHGLKGAAFYVECPPLADAAGALEDDCDDPPPHQPMQQWQQLEALFEQWAKEE